MLKGMEKNRGTRLVGREFGGSAKELPKDENPTLAELGVDKKTSMVAQQALVLAKTIPEAKTQRDKLQAITYYLKGQEGCEGAAETERKLMLKEELFGVVPTHKQVPIIQRLRVHHQMDHGYLQEDEYRMYVELGCHFTCQLQYYSLALRDAKKLLMHLVYGEIVDELTKMYPHLRQIKQDLPHLQYSQENHPAIKIEEIIRKIREMI